MSELQREYPPQLPWEEIERPQIELGDILAVQAVAMGYIRMRARTRKSNAELRSHGFAMIETGSGDDNQEVYDGSVDKYMSCTVRKVGPDQWRMVVRFLSMMNTEATARSNESEEYNFDWLRNGNCMAWARTVVRRRDGDQALDVVTDAHPITSVECEELQSRMWAMSERVNPLLPGSIYAPAGHVPEIPEEN